VHSVGFRLLAVILVVALPMAAAMTYIWWKTLHEGRALAAGLLRANAAQVSHDMDELSRQAEWVLSRMVQRPQVRALDPAVCNAEMAAIREMTPAFLLVTLWKRDGALVCSSIPPGPSKPPPQASREAFEIGIAAPGLALSGLFYGPITGLPLVTYTHPVKDEAGTPIGLLSLPIRMDRFDELLLALNHRPGSEAALLDASGTYVARVPDGARWRGKPGAGLPMVDAAMRVKDGIVPVVGVDGIRRTYAVEQLRFGGWRVVYGIDDDLLYAGFHRQFVQGMAVLLLVVALSLALAYGIARGIGRPLRELSAVADAVAAGGRALRASETGVAEIARVARHMNRMLDAITRTEARFRSLVELSSDFYWETDSEHRLSMRSMGSTPEVIKALGSGVGQRRWEIPYLAPGPEGWEAHKADLEARRPFRNFRFSRPAPNGTVFHFSVSGQPQFDAQGAFIGYQGVGTDLTERKREEDLRALEHEVTRLLADAEGEDAGLSAAMSAVCEAMGWAYGRYWALDEASGLLGPRRAWAAEGAAIWRYLEQTAEVRLALGMGMAGHVMQSGGPLWIEDLSHDPRVEQRSQVREFGLGGACGFPVIAGGRTIGVLVFVGRLVREPDRGILAAMKSLGSQIGQFLRRKQAESVLRDSHARLEAHARQQELVARFGQFALQHRTREELFAEVLDILAGQAEVAVLFELAGEGRILLRAAKGEAVASSVGSSALLRPDSAASRVLAGGAPVQVDEGYLASTPDDWPWAAWLRRMRSGVYVPVAHDGHASGMLGMFSTQAGAFADEVVRFAEAIGYVLSTALQREDAERRLAVMAQFDALTGLPNRSLLQDRLEQAIAHSRRRQGLSGVLFVDLDRFKIVNDTLGHQVGDQLLREVAQRLQHCVRADDTVGRISGDEFAIVLDDLGRAEDAGPVAQKVIDALAKPFALQGSEAFVSASIGISVFPLDGADGTTLLRNADMAMYQAKESGRSAYRYFTAEMNERSAAKLQLNTDLRWAVERREFVLHYQPKVDLATGALVGMEALLRWQHPQRGLVSPLEFIFALEDSGLILPVGEWVLAEACAQIVRWREAGLAPVPVAVNLSAKQFRRPDLDRLIQQTLDAAGVQPALIELEITESSIADDPDDALRQLGNLRAAGLRISVDDFGTGYSSLAYLTSLPLSALKIDRSFVRDAHLSAKSASVVQAVIDMAHNLNFIVIAEGVESDEHVAFLRRHGCDQAQGYLFGRPMPADDMAARLGAAP